MSRKNLKDLYDQASAGDREQGVKSYPCYHDTLQGYARFYAAPFVQTVEAFAALSPNNDLHGNLRSLASLLQARMAREPLDTAIVSTYRACAERAWGYLSGDVSFLDTVKGPKITAFRHNILYPTTSTQVTVDGHMVGAWLGDQLTMSEANLALNPAMYREIAQAIRGIARREKIPVPAAQATLWITKKRLSGVKYDPQIDLFTRETRWSGVISPRTCPPYYTQPERISHE